MSLEINNGTTQPNDYHLSFYTGSLKAEHSARENDKKINMFKFSFKYERAHNFLSWDFNLQRQRYKLFLVNSILQLHNKFKHPILDGSFR